MAEVSVQTKKVFVERWMGKECRAGSVCASVEARRLSLILQNMEGKTALFWMQHRLKPESTRAED